MIECRSTKKKPDGIEWDNISNSNLSTNKKNDDIDSCKISQIGVKRNILNPYIILTDNKWGHIRTNHTKHQYNL